MAAHSPARRRSHLRSVQGVLGQGLVEPAPELALPPQDGRGSPEGRPKASTGEGEESRTPHRAQVREEESRLGRLRVGSRERQAFRPFVGHGVRMGGVSRHLARVCRRDDRRRYSTRKGRIPTSGGSSGCNARPTWSSRQLVKCGADECEGGVEVLFNRTGFDVHDAIAELG